MNRINSFGLLMVLWMAIIAMPFAAMAEDAATPAKSSGIVDDLTSKLSLKPEQALGAAGAVFALAKTKMTADDFTKLAGGFPEMESLLKAAPAAASSGSTSALSAAAAMAGSKSGAAGLLSQFNALGISAESAAKIVPEILSFVKGKQGNEVMGLLSKAIQ